MDVVMLGMLGMVVDSGWFWVVLRRIWGVLYSFKLHV